MYLSPTHQKVQLAVQVGVDEPLGCRDGRLPRPQAPGLPEGVGAGAASVLFSFSLFQFYILKTELAVGKAWRAFRSNFPEQLVLSMR